jgi:protein-S-isoprenylcysteine O-methyltransferase Ste14
MGLTPRAVAARVAYGLAFTVALPALLIAWAGALHPSLPAYQFPEVGWTLVVMGLAIWIAAVIELVRRGRGLPMNAFPPERLVTSGVYAVVAHPIYVGWVIACGGLSLATGSAAGLWVITPLVALGATALVIGLERPSLVQRFGDAARFRPWLSLPPDDAGPPSLSEGLAIWIVVLLPWLVAYEGVTWLGQPPDAIDLRLAQEPAWPVWVWTVVIYSSAYVVVPLAALLTPTRARLHAFAIQGLVATALLTVVYLCLPTVAPFRPFNRDGILGALLDLDQRGMGTPVAACPAFHVLWAAFAAEAIGARSRGWRIAAWLWAIGVSVSCVTTGMHAVADVAVAWIFFVALRQPARVGRLILDGTERLANSWRAWRIGPVRVISHGVFAGAAAAIGFMGMGMLAGPDALPAFLVVAASALVGAALWAQLVEGSPRLQRPFGYYGGVLGGVIGAAGLLACGQPIARVLAATAVMAPWIQAIGRLRCVVQGCCHGRIVRPEQGIRVWNEHSRVVSLAGLTRQPLHPTALYSIAGNIVIGSLLVRLWCLHAPLWFITGLYFMLAGCARLMEEAYRGEPQTIRILGLPMYQYLAAASVLAGAWLTTLGGDGAPAVSTAVNGALILAATVTGAACWFAMGIDFPDSTRRFARLSG